jgi:7-cyano-7-deazaguanine synthase
MDSCVTAAVANEEADALAFLHVSYGQRTEARERRAFEELADYYGVEKRLVVSLEHLRNAHLLAVATSWAEVLGAEAIYIGAVAEDSSGYPDCRPEFYEAFQEVIRRGTKPETQIEIRTPVIHLKKSEIVNKGQELKAPLNLTWSCYKESVEACGECDSCALRLRAFRLAGVTDPISYVLDSNRFAY